MFNTQEATKPYYNQMGYSEDILKRFWSKVDVKKLDDGTDDLDACMEWTTGCFIDGYGQFWVNRMNVRSHRFIWECYNGPIPKDLQVLHSCDNPSCVNPKHLWIGTNQENTQDRHDKGRSAKGSSIGCSVLKEKDIVNILENINNGYYNKIKDILDNHSVSRTNINRILKGDGWSHVSIPFCKNLNISLNDLRKKVLYNDYLRSGFKDSHSTLGSRNGNSILNETLVLEIKDLLVLYTNVELGNMFSVCRSAISDIRIGKRWSHITGIKRKKGRKKGSDCHTTVLNDDKVREIRKRLKNKETGASLGREFNVTMSVISKIKLNKIWKHVVI